MTHNQLIKNFYIEYDKAYAVAAPYFTTEEVLYWLNKAYVAVISQKYTGTNARKVAFEGDPKRISDLGSLIKTEEFKLLVNGENTLKCELPESVFVIINGNVYAFNSDDDMSLDSECVFGTHKDVFRFRYTAINKPWIPNPLMYVEKSENNNKKSLHILYDALKTPARTITNSFVILTYLLKPNQITLDNTALQVDDNMCYDIINTAVIFALENVESTQRIQTKTAVSQIQE